jgi:hypothetical protein
VYGGTTTGCYEQIIEYRYQREVDVYRTEFQYRKQIRTVVTHVTPGSGQDVSDWEWYSEIYQWSFEDVDVLESGDFGASYSPHGEHTDRTVVEYRYVKTGESRQVLVDTAVETTDWRSGPPDGGGWTKIDERAINGDEIPCGEPPSFPPEVVEEWGDCSTGDIEVTGTRTTTTYKAVYSYDTDTWEKVIDGEPVVETISRPLNAEEIERCSPPPTEPTTPPTEPTTPPTEPTTPPTGPTDPTTPPTEPTSTTTTTTAPTVRIAAVTPLCHKDAPYIAVTFGGDPVFNGRTGTVSFVDVNGTTVATHSVTFRVGDTVQFVYPGASVDAGGNATDWPGWRYANGQWVPDSSDAHLRQGLTVVLTVNPTDTATVQYPPATSGCNVPENVPTDSSSGFTLPETL